MARTLTNARLRRRVPVPSGRKLLPQEFFDLRGLDQITPHDIMDDSHSPSLRNVRLYSKDDEGRRVAIKTRKGPGFYTVPIGQTEAYSETSTTGAADEVVNTVNWVAEKFSPSSNGRLTRADLRLQNSNGAIGNVVVKVYTDDSGEPGTVIATSSVPGSDIPDSYGYVTFNFIDAPAVETTADYWISAALQEGGSGSYNWSSTTNSSNALETNTSGGSWTAINVGMNLKTYVSTTGRVRGLTRYYPTDENRETLFVHSVDLYKVDDDDGTTTSLTSALEANGGDYRFDSADDKVFFVNSSDDPKVYNGTTVAAVGGSPGDSKLLRFHKNRLFLVPTSDPTRVNFSDLGDYATYEATAFFYVPAPLSSDPIQQLISFQDSLIIFTENSKWTLSGVDLATFTLREALGKEGLANPNAADFDDNHIYFVSKNGFFRWNGSRDEYLSARVEPEFSGIANWDLVNVQVWKNQVRIYYPTTGSPINNRCLIWDKVYEEWLMDTDTPISQTFSRFKEDDLVEASDRVGALYFAEQDYSIVGKPIDFEYRTKYHSFGNSAAKKQVRRFYPLLRAQTAPFDININVDKDFRDSPDDYTYNTQGAGATWGGGDTWGGGETWGSTSLIDPRKTIPGQAVYWQFRFKKSGANTPVEIIGYMMYPRLKRPK